MEHVIAVALTHLVAFIGFIWVINRYATGPVISLLDERRERIASQFDEIDTKQKRVAVLKDDYEAKLRDIDDEARKRVQEEVARGRRIAEEIVENARAEASEILEKSRMNTEIQVEQARAELKDEIIAMTIAATENLLRENLDYEKQRRLVGAFIEGLDSGKN